MIRQTQSGTYQDPALPAAQRAADLLQRMTVSPSAWLKSVKLGRMVMQNG